MASPQVTHGLPDDQLLAALGRVAIRHGQLDAQLIYCLKSLNNLAVSAAFNDNQRTPQWRLRKAVEAAVQDRLKGSNVAIEMLRYLDRVEELSEVRNDVIHGYWVVLPDGRRAIDRKGAYRPVPSATELDDLADSLNFLRIEINTARLQLQAAFSGAPENATSIEFQTTDEVTGAAYTVSLLEEPFGSWTESGSTTRYVPKNTL